MSGAIPIFSFLAAAAFLRSERVTALRATGVLIGFAGVLLVARPCQGEDAVDGTGVLYMVLGSASVGVSFVYATRFLSDLAIPAAAWPHARSASSWVSACSGPGWRTSSTTSSSTGSVP